MTTQTAVQTAPVPPSQWQLFAATFFRNKGAVLGLVVLIIMVISALLAPLLAGNRRALAQEGARLAGLSRTVVSTLLDLEHTDKSDTIDPARLFPDYLIAVEQLSTYVDRLEP